MAASTAVKHKDKADLEECASCAITENHVRTKLKRCSRCKMVSYCSKECQRLHWVKGGHREFCIPPQERFPNNDAAETETNNKSICLICRLEVSHAAEHELWTLPCTHMYHAKCIISLDRYATSKVCPACRAPLPLPMKLKYIEGLMVWTEVLISFKERTGHSLDCTCHTPTPSEQRSLSACIKLFTESAELGDLDSALFMGRYYQHMQPDLSRSVFYLSLPAAEMNVRAQYMIGVMYLNGGPGLKLNHEKGIHYLRLSAAQEDHEAQCILGTILRVSKTKSEQEEGFALLNESALQNNPAATCELGVIYYEGSITDKSYERAFKNIECAARNGLQLAMYLLSGLHKRGHGCAQSHQLAQEWLLEAETGSNPGLRTYVAAWFHSFED